MQVGSSVAVIAAGPAIVFQVYAQTPAANNRALATCYKWIDRV